MSSTFKSGLNGNLSFKSNTQVFPDIQQHSNMNKNHSFVATSGNYNEKHHPNENFSFSELRDINPQKMAKYRKEMMDDAAFNSLLLTKVQKIFTKKLVLAKRKERVKSSFMNKVSSSSSTISHSMKKFEPYLLSQATLSNEKYYSAKQRYLNSNEITTPSNPGDYAAETKILSTTGHSPKNSQIILNTKDNIQTELIQTLDENNTAHQNHSVHKINELKSEEDSVSQKIPSTVPASVAKPNFSINSRKNQISPSDSFASKDINEGGNNDYIFSTFQKRSSKFSHGKPANAIVNSNSSFFEDRKKMRGSVFSGANTSSNQMVQGKNSGFLLQEFFPKAIRKGNSIEKELNALDTPHEGERLSIKKRLTIMKEDNKLKNDEINQSLSQTILQQHPKISSKRNKSSEITINHSKLKKNQKFHLNKKKDLVPNNSSSSIVVNNPKILKFKSILKTKRANQDIRALVRVNTENISRKASPKTKNYPDNNLKDSQKIDQQKKVAYLNEVLRHYARMEFHRCRTKDILLREPNVLDERKQAVVEEWFKLLLETREFTLPSFEIQLQVVKILGDIFAEFKDMKNAIYYYQIAKGFAEIKKKYHFKLDLYTILGQCYRNIYLHENAIVCYKKQLQLSWDVKNLKAELNAYDNLGIEYYYLGDIERAVYYHDRMTNGDVEPDGTAVKEISLEMLQAKRKRKAYKKDYQINAALDNISRLEACFTSELPVMPHFLFNKTNVILKKKKPQRERLPSPKTMSFEFESKKKYGSYNEDNDFSQTPNLANVENKNPHSLAELRRKNNEEIRSFNIAIRNKPRYHDLTTKAEKNNFRRQMLKSLEEGKKKYVETYIGEIQERADKLKNLRYIPKKKGKYLLFQNNYSHLSNLRSQILKATILKDSMIKLAKTFDSFKDLVMNSIKQYVAENNLKDDFISILRGTHSHLRTGTGTPAHK